MMAQLLVVENDFSETTVSEDERISCIGSSLDITCNEKGREKSRRLKEKNMDNFVRRSNRDPNASLLGRRDVKQLLRKIRLNHRDTVVFKIKDHIMADINSTVLDEIIAALCKNRVCQALYVQNLTKAMGDTQLKALIELFKSKQIWCLNIGENYNISLSGWKIFCRSLSKTNITHLYVSEHVIKLDLKNEMRSKIRENRKKHDLHCSLKNLKVIEKCTNMWW